MTRGFKPIYSERIRWVVGYRHRKPYLYSTSPLNSTDIPGWHVTEAGDVHFDDLGREEQKKTSKRMHGILEKESLIRNRNA